MGPGDGPDLVEIAFDLRLDGFGRPRGGHRNVSKYMALNTIVKSILTYLVVATILPDSLSWR